MKTWTAQEEKLLKRYCGRIPNEELYELFSNHSKKAVYYKAVNEGLINTNGIVEKENSIRKKQQNFKINFKIKDYVKININHEGRKIRDIKGVVISIKKHFILIKNEKYKECFLRNDIKCNRVRIEVLKKCS